MLPRSSKNAKVIAIKYPSKTYKIDFDKKRIVRDCNGLESVVQAVRKLLFTERYAYSIYGSDYGVELWQMIGKDLPYVEATIGLRITAALKQDNRVIEVKDITVAKIDHQSLLITFVVVTEFGDASISGSFIKSAGE